MKDYTQKRLEFEKYLDTIICGYSYAQDGGNGGYEFKDITDHIDTFITQAIAEERARVVGEIKKQIAIHTQLEKEWTGISLTDFTKSRINPHTERREELSDLLTSLEIINTKE